MFARKWLSGVVVVMILLISSASSQWGTSSSRAKKEGCPKPSLKNGKIKPRSNGRVVKYSCNRDYTLVGESTSTCLQGEWTSETPVCVAKGCDPLSAPPSGRLVPSLWGAVLRLECNPGYYPVGSPMLYCDKYEWNGTTPACRASGIRPTMSCDFESEDLCGWVQDTTDEFDWTWQSYGTPSSHLGTGPSFDHTLGTGKGGHYLFIESSSPRLLDDKSRLYSPVYSPPELGANETETGGACFTFWYHMYGSTTGRLQVYIKLESVPFSASSPAFSRSGDQGNQWRQGFVPLPGNLSENFQIVIEGVRGTGYVGDSAIDDVWLGSGEACAAAKDRMEADWKVPSRAPDGRATSTTLAPGASCFNRCSSSTTTTSTTSTPSTLPGGASDPSACGCLDSCLLNNSCCIDYAAYCLTGTSTQGRTEPIRSSTFTTTTIPRTRPSSSSSPATTVTEAAISTSTATMASSITSRTTWKPTTSTFTSPTTTVSSTTTMMTRATMTTSSSTTSAPTTGTSITLPIRPTTTTRTTTTSVPAMSKATTVRPTTSIMTTMTTTPSTTTTSIISSRRTTISVTTTLRLPSDGVQGDQSPSGPSRIYDDTGKSSGSRGGGNPSKGLMVGAVAGGVAGALLLVAALAAVLILRARRAKIAGGGARNHQQDLLAEDSDVRYLRDEDDVQLDLTEATPSSRRTFADFQQL